MESAITAIILAILGFFFNRKLKKMDIDAQANLQTLKLKYEEEAKEREETNKRSLDELYERMSKRMTEVELVIEDMRIEYEEFNKNFRNHVGDNLFPDEFMNDIKTAHNDIMLGNENLVPRQYKSIMSRWAELVAAFGLEYYKGNERKKKGVKLKIYLNNKKTELIDSLNEFIDSRRIENKDVVGKKIKLTDYLKSRDIHLSTNRLFEKLLRNGLSIDEFKNLFSDYLIEFDSEFLSAVADYREQKDYSLINYERKLIGDD